LARNAAPRDSRAGPQAIRLIAALVAALALSACTDRDARSAPPAPAATGEGLVLRETLVADLKPVAAVVTARDMGEARAHIGGTRVSLAVKEGDTVARDQVIAPRRRRAAGLRDPRLRLQDGLPPLGGAGHMLSLLMACRTDVLATPEGSADIVAAQGQVAV